MAFIDSKEDNLNFFETLFDSQLTDVIKEECRNETGICESDDIEKVIEEVTNTFKRNFQVFLPQAYDSFFVHDNHCIKSQEEAASIPQSEILNDSVTENDLLKMDEYLERCATRRKLYPERLSLCLDKYCRHKIDSCRHIKVEVGKGEDNHTLHRMNDTTPSHKLHSMSTSSQFDLKSKLHNLKEKKDNAMHTIVKEFDTVSKSMEILASYAK